MDSDSNETDDYYSDDLSNNDNEMDIILEDIGDIDTDNHISEPLLTKYEKVMVKIERIEQITNGSIPLILNAENYTSIEDIVEEELKQKKIPFILKRKIGRNIDYYKLGDLEVIN